jgi:hypothetical protein
MPGVPKEKRQQYSFSRERRADLDVKPDGREREYVLDLAGTPTYRGANSQLMIQLPGPKRDSSAVVREIALIGK